MPHDVSPEDRIGAARADLRQAIMIAFCNVLHASRLPPMTVMELAAEAVGSIYGEVAEVHRGDEACSCGWKPSPEADIQALRAALAPAEPPRPVLDLRMLQTLGQA